MLEFEKIVFFLFNCVRNCKLVVVCIMLKTGKMNLK